MPERTTGDRTGSVCEVEFRLRSSAYPFVGASRAEQCRFELAEMIPRPGGRYAEFFRVTGTDPARVQALVADHETVDASLVAAYEDGGLFEFRVSEDCPAVDLAELGALPRKVRSEEGTGRIVADVPPEYDSSTVVESFLDETPDATLAAKREKSSVTPPLARTAYRQVLRDCLTDRQREVVRAAFEAGYYDWPRECTGEDVAAELDISSATFSEHIHAAERKLLAHLFGGPQSDRPGG